MRWFCPRCSTQVWAFDLLVLEGVISSQIESHSCNIVEAKWQFLAGLWHSPNLREECPLKTFGSWVCCYCLAIALFRVSCFCIYSCAIALFIFWLLRWLFLPLWSLTQIPAYLSHRFQHKCGSTSVLTVSLSVHALSKAATQPLCRSLSLDFRPKLIITKEQEICRYGGTCWKAKVYY